MLTSEREEAVEKAVVELTGPIKAAACEAATAGAEKALSRSLQEKYVTLERGAELLGIGRETLEKFVTEQGLPAFKAGKGWLFDIGQVEGWFRTRAATMAEIRLALSDDPSVEGLPPMKREERVMELYLKHVIAAAKVAVREKQIYGGNNA